PQHFIPKFKTFTQTIDSAFTSKIKRITILNATFAAVNILKAFPARKSSGKGFCPFTGSPSSRIRQEMLFFSKTLLRQCIMLHRFLE
ncbi:MAG: hypothetical protein J6S58_09940, partial [Lentisphaeria bacterium]|nr:hypothetical protein [Lentisphaeria bacterium]